MARRALRKIDAGLDLSGHLLWPQLASGATAGLPSSADLPVATAVSSATDGRGMSAPKPWDAAAIFGRRAALEVEVGSGKGLFIARAAAAAPQHDFLGIELAKKYAHYAAARLARAGTSNARILCGDAVAFFRELPDDAALAAVHVYFPDPWWKKRHHKRRVMNAPFVRDVERTLTPGGTLHFWTDVEEYFLESLTLIAAETRLVGPLPVDERPAAADLDYRTHFERRTRLSQQPVHRAEFRKR